VLYLLAVPANNERGPRYMEKALAAIHQARLRYPVTFMYGNHEDQVGLFLSGISSLRFRLNPTL
jgi:hypothetical protein